MERKAVSGIMLALLLTSLLALAFDIQRVAGSPAIVIDGDMSDWFGIEPVITDPLGDSKWVENDDIGRVWMIHEGEYLFVLLEVVGQATSLFNELFFDVDRDPSTGYVINDVGADYMARLEAVYQLYQYIAGDWLWVADLQGARVFALGGDSVEARVPVMNLGFPSTINVVFSVGPVWGYEIDTAPDTGHCVVILAEPRTWTVDDDGPADFHTVQEAVNAANPGDTIYVHNGTYKEHIVVDRSNLTLIAESTAAIIDGDGIGTVVQIAANNVEIDGFTIRNGGPTYYGVRLDSSNNRLIGNDVTSNYVSIGLIYSSNNTISSNNVKDNHDGGICLDNAYDNTLIDNIITGNSIYGIHIWHSANNVISSNEITDSPWYGIYLARSSSNTFSSNLVAKNGEDGILFEMDSNNNSLFNNHITNNGIGICVSGSSNNTISANNITNNNWSSIMLDDSSNNTIDENNIAGSLVRGIELWDSYSNTLAGNNIRYTKSLASVLLVRSPNNNIFRNNITENDYGIYLAESSNNTVSENIMNGNRFSFGVYGWGVLSHYIQSIDVSNLVNGKPVYYLINQKDLAIYPSTHPQVGYLALINSTNITVEDLNLANNCQGLLLAYTNHSRITNNDVTYNDDGIRLDWGSSNNTIAGNNIAHNNYGVIIRPPDNIIRGNQITNNDCIGLYLWWHSDNTLVCGNNFTSNGWVAGMTGTWAGIVLYYSSNDIFYHNNFANNKRNVISEGSTNSWDDGYPSGGNYWSDYTGVDANGDGIGDTPYVIDGTNQDRYPLMSPWRERTVGVKVGDWAIYSVDTGWTGVLNPFLQIIGEIEWVMVEVTDVQGTMVTFTGTNHFKNGSALTATGVKWDVAPTGSFGFVFWFIGSNLQAGDRVYQSGPISINETVAGTYCGVPREINYLNLSSRFSIVPGPPYDLNEFNCYWDQATGILTEELLECSTEDLSSSLLIHIKMVTTNLWKNPFPEDLNCDGKADIRDIAIAGLAFGSHPGHSRWKPQADINQDGKVDIRDMALVAKSFGKTYP